MKTAAAVRAIVAFVVLAASTWVTLTAQPNLGLDLRGGTQLVLETQSTDQVEANAENTDRALEVLRRRVDSLGVSEPTIARAGENQIIVELPDVTDPREAVEALGTTAQLTFHPVLAFGGGGTELPEPTTEPTTEPAPEPEPEATDSPRLPGPQGEATEPEPETEPAPTDEPAPTPEPTEGATPNPDGSIVLQTDDGTPLTLDEATFTGESVNSADAVYDVAQYGGWAVSINFDGTGANAWAELTGAAACFEPGNPQRQVAIVLDEEIITSAQVNPSIGCNIGITGGSTIIDGDFDEERAQTIAALIEGGGLPLPVEVIEQRTVGPTLGAAAIEASAQAAIIGLVLTGIFIIATYRLLGLMAVIALLGYTLISYATLTALGATLTLPGLAGFVLAIGMAVDANVLVFERAREDYVAQEKRSLKRAVQSGFRNALSAIADSNITTLLAAGLLFFLAAGPVRGFGITLSIGVLASMLSALVVSRVLSEFAVARGWVRKHPHISGISRIGPVRKRLQSVTRDLFAKPGKWLAVSGVVVAISIVGIFVRGLEFGYEFTGGRLIEVATTEQVDVDTARAAVADAGFPNAVVQESGDADIAIRSGELTDEEAISIREALGDVGGGAETVRDELISASLGATLLRNAIIALGVALLAQLAYLAFRFRWTYGSGAVIALFQNVAVVLGLFAWTGRPIDAIFLAAMLTIIGYTVNDTVVVYDRVRETRRDQPDEVFSRVASTAVLNTIPRTVNTGISTLFVLGALLVLGGDSLADFSLALLIGVLVGVYSSNFTATPFTVIAENRWPPEPDEDDDTEDMATAKGDRDDPGYGAIV